METTKKNRRYPVNVYEIWIGKYNVGQGETPPTEPERIAVVGGLSFGIACLTYELRSMLDNIERATINDHYIDHQSCRWFYDFDGNSNMWTGRYYETKEEAEKTFNLTEDNGND